MRKTSRYNQQLEVISHIHRFDNWDIIRFEFPKSWNKMGRIETRWLTCKPKESPIWILRNPICFQEHHFSLYAPQDFVPQSSKVKMLYHISLPSCFYKMKEIATCNAFQEKYRKSAFHWEKKGEILPSFPVSRNSYISANGSLICVHIFFFFRVLMNYFYMCQTMIF